MCSLYQIFVISEANKQYKTKDINSLGPEKLVGYTRYFVISDLFIMSFHCMNMQKKPRRITILVLYIKTYMYSVISITEDKN